MPSYDVIRFHQYESTTSRDELLLFAAKAKDLYRWAGIPRKGWHIRMLFQRPITPSRELELKKFWQTSSSPGSGEEFILGPTAIIVAIQDYGALKPDGKIDLSYECPVDLMGPSAKVIQELAGLLAPRIAERLSPVQREILSSRANDPFDPFPPVENDYVYEFALQLQQLSTDATRFTEDHDIPSEGQDEIIEAMEAILRPAIVVDGQHRLYGAANVDKDILLPVVAIPHCPWTEQVYQFVVINEKAQRVDQSLLTDIFGSSLTKAEQHKLRAKLIRSNVDIEPRIAAVVAGRTAGSPFENMVVVKMEGKPPAGIRPYISDRTIRALIDGSSQKYSWGWRTNEDFYKYYVSPTYPDRDDWDLWSGGAWQRYWFAFWATVRDFYNAQAQKEKRPSSVWSSTEQTNLTKAVTLRQLQTLFMSHCVNRMKEIEGTRDVLVEALGDLELADQKLEEQRRARALPGDTEEFKDFVRREFLENGIPVRVFTATWKASLDDAQGQSELWDTLSKAFIRTKRGERFVVKGQIFDASDE